MTHDDVVQAVKSRCVLRCPRAGRRGRAVDGVGTGLPRSAVAGETIDVPVGTRIAVRLTLSVPELDWRKQSNQLDGIELIAVTPERSRIVRTESASRGQVAIDYETHVPEGGVLFRAVGYREVEDGPNCGFYTNPIRIVASGQWVRPAVEIPPQPWVADPHGVLTVAVLAVFSLSAVGGWLVYTGKFSLLFGKYYAPLVRLWRSSTFARWLNWKLRPYVGRRGNRGSPGAVLSPQQRHGLVAVLVAGTAVLGAVCGSLMDVTHIPWPAMIAGVGARIALGAALGALCGWLLRWHSLFGMAIFLAPETRGRAVARNDSGAGDYARSLGRCAGFCGGKDVTLRHFALAIECADRRSVRRIGLLHRGECAARLCSRTLRQHDLGVLLVSRGDLVLPQPNRELGFIPSVGGRVDRVVLDRRRACRSESHRSFRLGGPPAPFAGRNARLRFPVPRGAAGADGRLGSCVDGGFDGGRRAGRRLECFAAGNVGDGRSGGARRARAVRGRRSLVRDGIARTGGVGAGTHVAVRADVAGFMAHRRWSRGGLLRGIEAPSAPGGVFAAVCDCRRQLLLAVRGLAGVGRRCLAGRHECVFPAGMGGAPDANRPVSQRAADRRSISGAHQSDGAVARVSVAPRSRWR